MKYSLAIFPLATYPLAILLLASLSGISQAQSGTRGSGTDTPAEPQGSGSRPAENSILAPSSGPALQAPTYQEAPAVESYSVPQTGSGTRGNVAPAPYAGQQHAGQPPAYAPVQSSNCGRIHSYSAPTQTYYVPAQTYYVPAQAYSARPVHYRLNYRRPYYGRSYYGRRFYGGRRYLGY